MKTSYRLLILFCAVLMAFPSFARKRTKESREYVILASMAVKNDTAWIEVVNALQKKHQAEVLFYTKTQRENLEELRRLRPRYVAVVEKPENIGRETIIDFHIMSREIDEDIYEDFLWGFITGYDAACAMKMINNSTEPLIIRNAVSSITELKSAKWFDHYGWVDDRTKNMCGEKNGKGKPVISGQLSKPMIETFMEYCKRYNPDLVVTASHASEWFLQMPYGDGYFSCKDGKLIAHANHHSEMAFENNGRRKVYFAVGNCLIGNVNNTPKSMAIAWINGADAATMIGYVVPTWHGRAGWGGLKYWLTVPGRYTLAEAIFLNQQDLLHRQHEWYPSLSQEKYPFELPVFTESPKVRKFMTELLGRPATNDEVGFWHDRDVLAYYGDPKWEVRLQNIPEEDDFTVTSKIKGKRCVITIKTNDNFSLQRMKGDHFKEEHVSDIPFSYFFPQRLNNPRLAKGQEWKVALDENFLLVYNCDFEPGKTYKIVVDIDK